MSPQAIEALRRASELLTLGLTLANQVSAILRQFEQNAEHEPTPADLEALKTARESALDRLTKSVS